MKTLTAISLYLISVLPFFSMRTDWRLKGVWERAENRLGYYIKYKLTFDFTDKLTLTITHLRNGKSVIRRYGCSRRQSNGACSYFYEWHAADSRLYLKEWRKGKRRWEYAGRYTITGNKLRIRGRSELSTTYASQYPITYTKQ